MHCETCVSLLDQLTEASDHLSKTTHRMAEIAGKHDPAYFDLVLSVRESRMRCAWIRDRLHDHRTTEHRITGATLETASIQPDSAASEV
jgi:hypothetical protein